MEPTNKPIAVSTVTPVFNGKDYLEELVAELAALREKWKNDAIPLELAESIFINDSSIDNSFEVLLSLKAKHDWIQIITLSRNYGQHSATIAGILHTCGDWVFTIDEDLQHEPKYFIKMLRLAVVRNLDIVYAKPVISVHHSFFRDQGSITYKKILSIVTANPHISSFNSFRLLRGAVARASASVCSHETYFDIALGWFSNRIDTVPLPLKDRRFIQNQKSGYNLWKLLSHARKMIVSSPVKVLRTGAVIGILSTIVSIACGGAILIQKIVTPDSIQVKGWTSIFLSILFFGGISAFLLGVILEYVTNMLLHSQGKPPFFIIERSSDAIVSDYFTKEETDDVSAA
ncbi:MAG TPA: glycosyltransferase [Chitinivibrionales bacterium]|jgi:glycosyltransferase involved in cell wall biosynthesis|nr:glycosyltransferase [Chitinivibrionales bacterium]